MITENKYYSYNYKELPKGCQFCVKGEKVVLFVTGLCPRKCYFCPVSDQKYGYDVSLANERKLLSTEDLIKEAQMMQAKGAGITGGDPIVKLDRTVNYIKRLKAHFGKDFHIHLYTSLNLVTDSTLQKLYQAGLDEIRFHLDLQSNTFWKKIELAKKFPWDVGVEIPLVPDKEKEIIMLIEFIKDKVQFINLNELERADNALSKLNEMGFETKEEYSYAIKGSLELGQKIINYVETQQYPLAVHVCSAKLKDKIQLTNRIERESINAKKEFDIVDKEGLLKRGALYLEDLAPGFDYRKKLAEIDKSIYLQKLQPLYDKIKTDLILTDNQIYLDPEKPRILLSAKNCRVHLKKFQEMGLLIALVLEYPTADQLEIEVEFLK